MQKIKGLKIQWIIKGAKIYFFLLYLKEKKNKKLVGQKYKGLNTGDGVVKKG